MSGASDVPAWVVTVDRVHELHAIAIETWGGSPGIRNVGCVDSSIGNSVQAALYAMETDDEEPDLLVVAAYLLFYLARNHCYTDGNKRIAWLAFAEQIAVHGLDVDATQEEVVRFVLDVAEGTVPNADGVRNWVAPRLVALPP